MWLAQKTNEQLKCFDSIALCQVAMWSKEIKTDFQVNSSVWPVWLVYRASVKHQLNLALFFEHIKRTTYLHNLHRIRERKSPCTIDMIRLFLFILFWYIVQLCTVMSNDHSQIPDASLFSLHAFVICNLNNILPSCKYRIYSSL